MYGNGHIKDSPEQRPREPTSPRADADVGSTWARAEATAAGSHTRLAPSWKEASRVELELPAWGDPSLGRIWQRTEFARAWGRR